MRTHWVRGLDGEWREEVLPGRYRPDRAVLQSNRVGRHQDREARTYHSHASSFRAGDKKSTVKGAIDYVARDADFKKKATDLECILGDAKALNSATAEIERTARIKRGPTAEKVLQKITLEIPASLTPAQRKEVAAALIASWAERGHIAVAAVHGNEVVQPHVHLLVTARPVMRTETGWAVDRTPGNTALRDRKALMAERHRTAEIINHLMDRDGVEGPRFFGGRDAQMQRPGIVDRQPQRRVPERAWTEGQRSVAPVMVREAHDRQRLGREAREAARAQLAADRAAAIAATPALAPAVATAEPSGNKFPDTPAARQVRQATPAQRRLILSMAHEAGVMLPEHALDQLDGGDILAAVKAAKKIRQERRDISAAQGALMERLIEARERIDVLQERVATVATERDRQAAMAEGFQQAFVAEQHAGDVDRVELHERIDVLTEDNARLKAERDHQGGMAEGFQQAFVAEQHAGDVDRVELHERFAVLTEENARLEQQRVRQAAMTEGYRAALEATHGALLAEQYAGELERDKLYEDLSEITDAMETIKAERDALAEQQDQAVEMRISPKDIEVPAPQAADEWAKEYNRLKNHLENIGQGFDARVTREREKTKAVLTCITAVQTGEIIAMLADINSPGGHAITVSTDVQPDRAQELDKLFSSDTRAALHAFGRRSTYTGHRQSRRLARPSTYWMTKSGPLQTA